MRDLAEESPLSFPLECLERLMLIYMPQVLGAIPLKNLRQGIYQSCSSHVSFVDLFPI